MASYTSNFGLKMPTGTENVSRQDYNNNLQKVDAAFNTRVKRPTNAPVEGQLLRSRGGDETEWADYAAPSDAQVATAVDAWLDEHPEATTTVQDGSITRAKLDSGLKDKTDLSANGFASEYNDTTGTYAVGDYCIRSGKLYRCTTAIATPEAWTAGHWNEVKITDELKLEIANRKSEDDSTKSAIPFKFETGAIDINSGADTGNNRRVRSVGYTFIKAGTAISIKSGSGYKFGVFVYSTASVSGFSATTRVKDTNEIFVAVSDCFVRIVIGKTNEVDINPSDVNVYSVLAVEYGKYPLFVPYLSISTSTGDVNIENQNKAYISVYRYLYIEKGTRIIFDTEKYNIRIMKYSSNTANSMTGYKILNINKGLPFIVDESCYYRFTFANKTETELTDLDIDNIISRFQIVPGLENDRVRILDFVGLWINGTWTAGTTSINFAESTKRITYSEKIKLSFLTDDRIIFVKRDRAYKDYYYKIIFVNDNTVFPTIDWVNDDSYVFSAPDEATHFVVVIGNDEDFVPTSSLISGFDFSVYTSKHHALDERTIIPKLVQGFGISTSKGYDGFTYNPYVYHSEKMIRIPDNRRIGIKANENCVILKIEVYGDDYSAIGELQIGENGLPITNSNYTDVLLYCGKYFRFVLSKALTQDEAFAEYPVISIIGEFEEHPYHKLGRLNSGKIPLAVKVRPYNSNYADTFIPDYGILSLPENYDPEGEPLRLIIYAHGAGGHYTAGTLPATSGQSCDPTYFLSEGYAVMDMDGNPYDHTIPHWFIPEAIESYVNGYNYVISNYNIKTDGVFVGGRSMGGGMVMEILKNGKIPVLSAFPVAMLYNSIDKLSGRSQTERNFWMQHYAVPGYDQITWTGQNPMTSAEWNFIKENIVEFAQFLPFLKIFDGEKIDGNVLMQDSFNMKAQDMGSLVNELETTTYSALRSRMPCPIKVYCAWDDDWNPLRRQSLCFYNQLKNTGSKVDKKWYASGGHNFEFAQQNLIASFTGSRGITVTNVPDMYVDAIAFCKQYEPR